AVTFTNDTLIGPLNTNFDGADITITNCTLTVDGPHGFNSLFVEDGGKLTHSFSPNGLLTNIIAVVDEPQVLNGTNPVPLLNTNISIPADAIVVTDTNHTLIYTNNLDYTLSSS